MIDINKKPKFTLAGVQDLAAKYYGLDGIAHELASERDQNFLLECSDGQRLVLKIANPSEDFMVLEFENQVLEHVAEIDSSIPIPRLFNSLSGLTIERIVGADEEAYFIRVINFLEGRPMALVKPYTPALLRELGNLLSRLDRAMKGLSNPVALRPFAWSLYQAPNIIKEHNSCLKNREQRRIVDHFLARFELFAWPRLPGLVHGLIHNDANDYNILVKESASRTNLISGLLDFGDLIWSPVIYEPAVAAAYAILDDPDPIGAAGYIVAGYHEAAPLSKQEIDIFLELITIRLCTSVVLAAHQRQLMPENEYLSISEKAAWVSLERLLTLDPDTVRSHFLTICQMGQE